MTFIQDDTFYHTRNKSKTSVLISDGTRLGRDAALKKQLCLCLGHQLNTVASLHRIHFCLDIRLLNNLHGKRGTGKLKTVHETPHSFGTNCFKNLHGGGINLAMSLIVSWALFRAASKLCIHEKSSYEILLARRMDYFAQISGCCSLRDARNKRISTNYIQMILESSPLWYSDSCTWKDEVMFYILGEHSK